MVFFFSFFPQNWFRSDPTSPLQSGDDNYWRFFVVENLQSVSAVQWAQSKQELVHHTCFKVSRKINQSDVLAKFCPTFLMTMIRHETGPFYRRPSEYAASLGEQTLTHQRYREKRSSLGLNQRGWVKFMEHFKIWSWNNWLLVFALFTSLLRALISGAAGQRCPLEWRIFLSFYFVKSSSFF